MFGFFASDDEKFARAVAREKKRGEKMREAFARSTMLSFDVIQAGSLGLPYSVVLNEPGVVVYGDIDLSGKNLTELPDYSGLVIVGNFTCAGNQLTSLKGAPIKVTGRFDCSGNSLLTLAHGPEFSGREYICAGNLLRDLRGAPKDTNALDCRNNPLFTFKGLPQNFNCLTADAGVFYSPGDVPASPDAARQAAAIQAEAGDVALKNRLRVRKPLSFAPKR
jgi:hypothetical protein